MKLFMKIEFLMKKVNDLMNLLENVDCEYDFETATDCYIDPSYKDFIEFF